MAGTAAVTTEYMQETKFTDEIRRLNRTLSVKGMQVISKRDFLIDKAAHDKNG